MSKFDKLCKEIISENNEFINIFSAHLDGYPGITFIDTDKDIGITVTSNSDHFDVIYNFDNKKEFKDLDQAIEYAKEKGEEMYAVYDFDSRTKFALDGFLKHATSLIGAGEIDKSQKYDSEFNYDNTDAYITDEDV